jgi:hypothetical protein
MCVDVQGIAYSRTKFGEPLRFGTGTVSISAFDVGFSDWPVCGCPHRVAYHRPVCEPFHGERIVNLTGRHWNAIGVRAERSPQRG